MSYNLTYNYIQLSLMLSITDIFDVLNRIYMI